MLIAVNMEKLKKAAPFADIAISNILSFVTQDIDIIKMLNKDEGLTENITEVKALIDCLEIRKGEDE